MLEEKVLDTINKYNLIDENDKIVVAVSGGADSMCLLLVLSLLAKKLKFEMVVCHVNHGLRENAKIDEAFVKEFCEKNNIICYIKHANIKEIAGQDKTGLEEAGRKVRYDFFNEILKKENASKIAIAHNAGDNAETILMNLFRGSGSSRNKRYRA